MINIKISPWARREGAVCHSGAGRALAKCGSPSPPSQRKSEMQRAARTALRLGLGRPLLSSLCPVADRGRPTPVPGWGHTRLCHCGSLHSPMSRWPHGAAPVPGGAQHTHPRGTELSLPLPPAAFTGVGEPAGALTPPVPSLSALSAGRDRDREGAGRGPQAVLALPPPSASAPGSLICSLLPTFRCLLSRLQPFLCIR